ncbi:hypothetical protein M0R04_14755 [Candidatus Dojkabacteria bacterium]|jgi:hypothetical protein|nr:hypothetical protein [Candidatus Dojkabacteria bacterium]
MSIGEVIGYGVLGLMIIGVIVFGFSVIHSIDMEQKQACDTFKEKGYGTTYNRWTGCRVQIDEFWFSVTEAKQYLGKCSCGRDK